MMSMLKMILLDIDGTMMDTEEIFYRSLQQTLDAFSISSVPDGSLFGMSVDQVLSKLDVPSPQKVKAYWETVFAEACRHHDFYPGIAEMAKAAYDRGLILYILSSRSHCTADPICEDSVIAPYISGCIAAEDTIRHKPDPEPVLKALAITGLQPDQVIYIGDTIQDYQAAHAAGIPFGLAGWNGRTAGVDCDYLFGRPEEILGLAGDQG